MKYLSYYNSPIGNLTLLADEKYLYGLWMENQKYFGSNYDLSKYPEKDTSILRCAMLWLDDYFSGKNVTPHDLPLNPEVSNFRRKVVDILMQVPYGETITYGEISNELQKNQLIKKNMSQAVGGAVGHNPISIIIPCHRVLGKNGSLTGYAGGIERKNFLLNLENNMK